MSHITILNSYVLRKCRTNCSKSLAEAKAFVNLFLVLLGTSGHLSINSELLVSFIDCLKNWVFHSWPLFLYFRLYNTVESKKYLKTGFEPQIYVVEATTLPTEPLLLSISEWF